MPLSVHLLFIILAFVLPYLITPRGVFAGATRAARPPLEPVIKNYFRNTAVWLLVAVLVVYVVAVKADQPLSVLGLDIHNWGRGTLLHAMMAAGVTAAVTLVLTRPAPLRSLLVESLHHRGSLHQPPLPGSGRECIAYVTLEVAEAVSAEVVYRGFVIFYLSLLMSPGGAATLSVLVFIWSEWFRGPREAFLAGIYGSVNAALFIISGGLLAPIAVSLALRLTRLTLAMRARKAGGSD